MGLSDMGEHQGFYMWNLLDKMGFLRFGYCVSEAKSLSACNVETEALFSQAETAELLDTNALMTHDQKDLVAYWSQLDHAMLSGEELAYQVIEEVISWRGEVMHLLTCKQCLDQDDSKVLAHVSVALPGSWKESNWDGLVSRYVLEHVPGHIYWHDRQGRVLGVNTRQAEKIPGGIKDEIKGTFYQDVVPGDGLASFLSGVFEYVMNEQKPIALEEVIAFPSGKRTMFSRKYPVMDGANRLRGLIGFSVDVTDSDSRKHPRDAERGE